jgi:hypothetical protein
MDGIEHRPLVGGIELREHRVDLAVQPAEFVVITIQQIAGDLQ